MTLLSIKLQKTGIGLRQPHWQAMMDIRPATGFLEIHAENFLGNRGRVALDDLRRDYKFSVHAVGLSLASAEGIDDAHLSRVASLVERLQPSLVSEHLCWSRHGGAYFNDLMPFPYTEEALAVVVSNIQHIQERLKRPILIENISAYLQFSGSRIPEGEFMAALVAKTGCGILCDVNNAYVNQINHGVDACDWLKTLPPPAVQEIHLAGHCANNVDGGEVLIDDHGSAVPDPVWELFVVALRLFSHAAPLVEWDANIPPLNILIAEAAKADYMRAKSGEVVRADAA